VSCNEKSQDYLDSLNEIHRADSVEENTEVEYDPMEDF